MQLLLQTSPLPLEARDWVEVALVVDHLVLARGVPGRGRRTGRQPRGRAAAAALLVLVLRDSEQRRLIGQEVERGLAGVDAPAAEAVAGGEGAQGGRGGLLGTNQVEEVVSHLEKGEVNG